jgi:thiosulfate/3-mercaptopyruvate sulfurtransferase
MPNDPFVDVGDLPSLGPLRYLDVRDQASFDAGHAPGAVRVPLDEWDAAAKAADTGFAKTAYWDSALNALGADPTLTAVTYGSGGMINAARVWFILQYYGLKAVIVNGGCILAETTGLPPAAAVSSVGFRAVPGSGPVGLVDRETLRDQLDGRAHVFDTRTRAEFTGEDARNRARSGHLPKARHLSHVDLLENGVVRPAAMLLDVFMPCRMFDSRLFPATGTWPPGIAAAEAIRAGDSGGKRAALLGSGLLVGLAGSGLKIPMSAFGVAFIGNVWALTMFGIGLLVRGYATQSTCRRRADQAAALGANAISANPRPRPGSAKCRGLPDCDRHIASITAARRCIYDNHYSLAHGRASPNKTRQLLRRPIFQPTDQREDP